MSSVLQRYKGYYENSIGLSQKDRLRIADKKAFEDILKTSPNSTLVNSKGQSFSCLILRKHNSSLSVDKRFIFEEEVPIKVGDVVSYKERENELEKSFILLYDETTQYRITKKFIGRRVTDIPYIFIDGSHELVPVYILLAQTANDDLTERLLDSVVYEEQDKSAGIFLPKTEKTIQIKPYTRIISMDMVYEITFVNKSLDGLIALGARIVKENPVTDDMETGKSAPQDDVEKPSPDFNFTGPTELLVGEIGVYTCPNATMTVEGADVIQSEVGKIEVEPYEKGEFTIYITIDETTTTQKVKVIDDFLRGVLCF